MLVCACGAESVVKEEMRIARLAVGFFTPRICHGKARFAPPICRHGIFIRSGGAFVRQGAAAELASDLIAQLLDELESSAKPF